MKKKNIETKLEKPETRDLAQRIYGAPNPERLRGLMPKPRYRSCVVYE